MTTLPSMTETLAEDTFGRITVVAPASRRRRILLVLLLVVALVVALVVSGLVVRRLLDDTRREYLSTSGWPTVGQGAYQVGDHTPRASTDQRRVPIASIAKVMTALVVLRHHPLAPGRSGPTLVVSAADVADTERRQGRGESLVAVRLGERLTERDTLMALMLPSANNVAVMLSRYVAGSVARFVVEMNATARELGMHDTAYTDPSGLDEKTVSTARDQLVLARVAAKNETLSQIMATSKYRLPVVGVVHNTDRLLGTGGFVGMKTGSHDAAGGCFMFSAYRSVDGADTLIVGVVLGQRGHNLITAGLYAAKQLVDEVAPEPAHP